MNKLERAKSLLVMDGFTRNEINDIINSQSTLRDELALSFLPALIQTYSMNNIEYNIEQAYKYADKIIKYRNQQ